MTCDPTWLTVLKTLPTPIIAMIALYIAFMQWRNARRKFVLDLFAERVSVLRDFETACAKALSSGKATQEAFGLAFSAKDRARFLFGRDVVDALDGIWKDITWRSVFTDDVIDSYSQADRQNHLVAKYEMFKRMSTFLQNSTDLFKPYLLLDDRL